MLVGFVSKDNIFETGKIKSAFTELEEFVMEVLHELDGAVGWFTLCVRSHDKENGTVLQKGIWGVRAEEPETVGDVRRDDEGKVVNDNKGDVPIDGQVIELVEFDGAGGLFGTTGGAFEFKGTGNPGRLCQMPPEPQFTGLEANRLSGEEDEIDGNSGASSGRKRRGISASIGELKWDVATNSFSFFSTFPSSFTARDTHIRTNIDSSNRKTERFVLVGAHFFTGKAAKRPPRPPPGALADLVHSVIATDAFSLASSVNSKGRVLPSDESTVEEDVAVGVMTGSGGSGSS
ncbi:hypothetical protein EV359DRAFT_83930 [Lentinula novae-zelandiae]|nr:hypothetical protein EV359DRAFT_83930 [Lentinula novae-zelandiae]